MNVEAKDAIHSCTSCQMCGAVCPHDAILIQLNADGFYRPTIDYKKCIDCGLCAKICYKYDESISITPTAKLSSIPVYAAVTKDERALKNVTSGGIADLLCEKLIAKGYFCVGVVYDLEKDIAVHKIVESREDTFAFRGSKYIQSFTIEAFKEIVKQRKDHKYAVFGTPCQIYALRKFQKRTNKQSDLLFIDIFCHGCPSMNIWKKYVSNIKCEVGDFDDIKFRSKYRGWGNFCVSAEKDAKTIYAGKKINDAFYTLFFSDLVLNDACADCKLRSTFDYTDLRLGDFWGREYDGNKSGVSVVVPVSDKGKEIFGLIRDIIVSFQHSHQDYMPYQSYGRDYVVDQEQRRRLFEIINDKKKSLREAVNFYHQNQPLVSKIKRYVKNMVLLMPIGIISQVKKMYH